MNPSGPKKRLYALFNRIPVIGETADPVVAGLLLVLAFATLVAVALPQTVFPGDRDARSHIIQVAAGLLLLLGAYFTPVGIRQLRVQQYADRLGKIIDQLGSARTVIRLGAVRLLHAFALEEPVFPADSTLKRRPTLEVVRSGTFSRKCRAMKTPMWLGLLHRFNSTSAEEGSNRRQATVGVADDEPVGLVVGRRRKRRFDEPLVELQSPVVIGAGVVAMLRGRLIAQFSCRRWAGTP